MEKILTISIAAYNVEKYIKKTLDSLMIKSMDELEVLIIDDGSKDKTLEIAKEYEKNFPNTFKAIHKENGGYGSTINKSIEIATGKYFKQLDGDDWFETQELEEFINELKTCTEDMIVTPFKRVFENDGHEEIRDESIGINIKNGKFNDVETKDWFTMHAITYRTEILQKNNIRITEKCFYTDQEYDLLPLRYVETIRFIPNVIYCYRIGRADQSVSPEGLEKHYKDQTIVLKRLYKEYENAKNQSTTKEKYIYNYFVRRTKLQIFVYLIISYSKKHKSEMIEFINYLKNEQKEVYKELCASTRTIRALEKSNYILYPILHCIRKKKYKY